MSRCYICDSPCDMTYNRLHKDFNPCPVCQEVIDNVFSDEDEEDSEYEPTLEDIYYAIEDVENEQEFKTSHRSRQT